VLAILDASLINNSRTGDVKEVLRAEMEARLAKLGLSLEHVSPQSPANSTNFSNWSPITTVKSAQSKTQPADFGPRPNADHNYFTQ